MGTARRILVDPDPRLRTPTRAVHLPDKGLRRLIDDMVVTMRKANGLGLAAPQIGESLRLAVVEVKGTLTVIGNPAMVKTGFPAVDWEGCLSVPDRVAQVRRAAEIVIVADDIEGRRIRHRATGLLARAFQHEMDHLLGRLYIDLVDSTELVDTRLHPTAPG
ncbi:MAG TPA: peptide deformylase [Candidatus Limnocylindrales bacterium]|jgi:peptide deformylase